MAARLIGGFIRLDVVDGGEFKIVGTVDKLGVLGKYRVRLFDRQTARCIRETWSADGAYVFNGIAYRDKGYTVIAYDHSDPPLNASIRDNVTPTLGDEPAWHLPMLDGRTVSGIATTPTGEPAELVSIRDWAAKKVIANVEPQADGSWSVTLPSGEYDITYYKRGCAPVCHGPYTILPE